MSQQSHDLLPDALHEALGQVIAEERRQWRRERELIQSEASRTIADLRATIAELGHEIRQKALEGWKDGHSLRQEFKPMVFIFNGTLWCLGVAAFAAKTASRVGKSSKIVGWISRALGRMFVYLGVRMAMFHAR